MKLNARKAEGSSVETGRERKKAAKRHPIWLLDLTMSATLGLALKSSRKSGKKGEFMSEHPNGIRICLVHIYSQGELT